MAESNWSDIVLKVLRETPSRSKEGAGFGLWVIQKVRDGKSYSVTVRSGSYYTDKVTGEKRYPKEGLNAYDFKALKAQGAAWTSEIEPMLNIPKDTPVDPRTESAQAPEADIETPPWMK